MWELITTKSLITTMSEEEKLSLSFYLPHKKSLFSNKILKVGEALELLPKLEQFSYNQEAENFDKDKLYESKLNEHTCLLLGIDLDSVRGFELSFEKDMNDKDAYRVRFFTPSAEGDWKVGLKFIKALAQKLNVGITSEYGEIFNKDTIEDFDYRQDIMFGISSMFAPSEDPETGELKEADMDTMTLFGLYRPFAIDRALKERFMNAPDPIKEFGKVFSRTQYYDAFAANQKFYQDKSDDSIFGMYTLTESVETILPFKPFVEFNNMNIVKPKQVENWKLNLIYIDGDEDDPNSYQVLDIVDYEAFMKHLPKDKYIFLDASYIELQGLSKKEMEEIIAIINPEV